MSAAPGIAARRLPLGAEAGLARREVPTSGGIPATVLVTMTADQSKAETGRPGADYG